MGVLRACAFLLLGAFILVGPAYRQLLGNRSPFPPRWTMFSGIALELIEVRIESRTGSGPSAVLDRFDVLGYPSRTEAPRQVRRLSSLVEAQQLARRLCRAVPADTEVRMRLRKAARDGWVTLDPGEADVCAATRRAP